MDYSVIKVPLSIKVIRWKALPGHEIIKGDQRESFLALMNRLRVLRMLQTH
jgi:hypothetical protein